MDSFKRLKIEYNGIKKVIESYTDSGNVLNFLNRLENAIEDKDGEIIQYCLSEISKWYHKNQSEINSNFYVTNKADHERNITLIDELATQLSTYVFDAKISKANQPNKPKVFISHSSLDKKYGDAVEELITAIGIPNSQLIYTSHPLHKIPTDENIYDYLRTNINRDYYVIYILSKEYFESSACLNEMGAAWVVHADYTSLFTPQFDFNDKKYQNCVVDSGKMGILLNGDENCEIGMTDLKNKLLRLYNITIDEKIWIVALRKFIDEIKPS